MSEKWKAIGSIVFVAIVWGFAGFTVAYTGLFSESPDGAFVRGYFHGAYYAIGVVDGKFNQGGKLISSFRECITQDSNASWQEWLEEIDRETKRDSLANISDSIYFDSTDTMPALEVKHGN